MTDGLFQQPEPDGFQNESPIRAFTDFKVEGNYAIGKGFRPSLAHLAAYLDAMQRKEGWRLVQILEAATAPTVIFIKTYAAPMYHITMGPPQPWERDPRVILREMADNGVLGEAYQPDKREPSIHVLHKIANGLHQVTDDLQAGMTIDGEIADKPAELVDRFNGHIRELEIEIGVNPSSAEAIRKIDTALKIVEPIPSGIYWSPEAGNFYSTASHKGQGVDFYRQWADRRDEFPGDPRQEAWPGANEDLDDQEQFQKARHPHWGDGDTPDDVTYTLAIREVPLDATREDILALVDDPINPKHYAGRECADIGERLSANGYQILKYCWRLGKKDDPCQELGKAIWYLESEAALLKCMAYGQGHRLVKPNLAGLKPEHRINFMEERIGGQPQFTQNIARMLWEGYSQRHLQAIRECIEEHRFHLECGRGLAV